MVCEIISGIESFADLLVWPTTCDYYFWLKILGVIMVILAWVIFKTDEKRPGGKGDLIGAIAVSSIAMTVIATLGSLIKSTAGIPMIQLDILLYFIAFCTVAVLLWIFKS